MHTNSNILNNIDKNTFKYICKIAFWHDWASVSTELLKISSKMLEINQWFQIWAHSQSGIKSDKSDIFNIKFRFLKKSICSIWCQTAPLWVRIWHIWLKCYQYSSEISCLNLLPLFADISLRQVFNYITHNPVVIGV